MRIPVVDRQFKALVSATCHGTFQQYKVALKQLKTVDRDFSIDQDQLLALKIIALIRSGRTNEGKESFKLLLVSNPALIDTFVKPKLESAQESNSEDFRAFIRTLGSKDGGSRISSPLNFKLLPVSIVLGLVLVITAVWYRTSDNSETNLELNNVVSTSRKTMMDTARQAVPLVVSRAKIIREDGSTFWFPVGHGSGFVASKSGVLITAAHVVEIDSETIDAIQTLASKNKCTVSDFDIACVFDVGGENRVIEGLHAQTSQDIDLAWIKINEDSPTHLSFTQMPYETDEVFALGYPGSSIQLTKELNASDTLEREERNSTHWMSDTGQTWLDLLGIQNFELEILTGSVNAITNTENGILIHHQVPATKGNSGGPLVNNDGGVVGIIILGHLFEESKQRALSCLSIYRELNNHKELEWPNYE